MYRRTACLTLSFLVSLLVLISSSAQATQVQLFWDSPTTNSDGTPLTNLAGYRVYYSQAGGKFASSVDVGKVTNYTLSGLQEGQTYYFVATAYNTTGQESGYSNEVSTTIPLPVSVNSFTVTPASIVTGNSATLAWTTTGATSVSITPGSSTNLSLNGSLTVSPSTTTTYTLTATGMSGTATRTVTVTVATPSLPTVSSFTATPASIAAGKSSVLAWSTTNATTVSISPSAGSNLSTTGSVNVTPTTTTTYTLTATGPGGTATASTSVTVTPPPVANFSASPSSGSAPLKVTFTDSSTGTISTWIWNFGDGGTSPMQHPTYTYQKAGTYTVSLTVSGPGGSHTRTSLITATTPPPVANFSVNTTSGNAPMTVAFSDTSTGTISGWNWNFGDGGTSTVQHPTYIYQKAGTYTVSLTVSGAGGSHTATKAGLIVVKPPEAVKLWIEAEEGQQSGLMEAEVDEEASSGLYVWVPEENGTILDASASHNFVHYTFTVPKADTYVIWGRVSPSATGTGSFFFAVDDPAAGKSSTEKGTVTNVAPSKYPVATLQVGDPYYIDRNFTLKTLPAELEGQLAIKTANTDKGNTSATFLTFTVSQSATVYVAYDARTSRFPDWLTASYTNTGQHLQTTDTLLVLWKREVPAGAVALPGNRFGNPVGAQSNYLVFVAFSVKTPASSPYLVWTIPSNEALGNVAQNVEEGTITNVAPSKYPVATLQVGDPYYIDRNFTLKTLPAELEGQLAIKTANADKGNTSATFLTFAVSQPATVYVAYDARASRFPDWLTASYTNTGQHLQTTDTLLVLWKREVPAGVVALPGNRFGNPVGAQSNYLVFVAFRPDSTSSPIMWVWDQAASDTMPIFFLEAGEHTLIIKQRESGAKLDQLLITNDIEYRP